MFYKYKVSYYNTYTDEECTDIGVVFASNFGTASARVAKEYGENVYEVTIREMLVEESSFCVNKDDIDYAFSHNE